MLSHLPSCSKTFIHDRLQNGLLGDGSSSNHGLGDVSSGLQGTCDTADGLPVNVVDSSLRANQGDLRGASSILQKVVLHHAAFLAKIAKSHVQALLVGALPEA